MADGMETFLTRRLAVVWLVSTDVAYLDYVSGKKSPSAAAVDCGMAKAWLRETWKNESLKPQDVSIIAGEIAKGGVKMIPIKSATYSLHFQAVLSGPFLFSAAI